MKIDLSEAYYNLLKSIELSAIDGLITFDDENASVELQDKTILRADMLGKEYESTPLSMLFECINDEIVESGLSDDQETVLPRGKELYSLYDSIYYSLPLKQTP